MSFRSTSPSFLGVPNSRRDLTDFFLDRLLCFPVRDVTRSEEKITPGDVMVTMTDCSVCETSGLDGLPYKLYRSMPDLFEQLLARVYANW